MTRKKFMSLSPQAREKHLKELLATYHELASYLDLSPIEPTCEALSNRHHEHLYRGKLPLKEHELLVRKGDHAPKSDFLPIAIYLDELRSAQNVGSIIRTTEALRLGSLYFSEKTPFIDHRKVQETSMGTFSHVPAFQIEDISSLPRPFIALETVEDAPSYSDVTYPETFTLLLGNEEYGLREKTLKQADMAVQIPLHGRKNSLNVACAYASLAAHIRKQR